MLKKDCSEILSRSSPLFFVVITILLYLIPCFLLPYLTSVSLTLTNHHPGPNEKELSIAELFFIWNPATTYSPGRLQPSTIGAERLNFCVRYGNRWDPFAIVTGILLGTFRTLKTAHPDFSSRIRPVFQFSLWSHLNLNF